MEQLDKSDLVKFLPESIDWLLWEEVINANFMRLKFMKSKWKSLLFD